MPGNKTQTLLHWHIDSLAESVNVQYEYANDIAYCGNMPFWSGLFLGIELPTIINVFYDALKGHAPNGIAGQKKEEEAENPRPRESMKTCTRKRMSVAVRDQVVLLTRSRSQQEPLS